MLSVTESSTCAWVRLGFKIPFLGAEKNLTNYYAITNCNYKQQKIGNLTKNDLLHTVRALDCNNFFVINKVYVIQKCDLLKVKFNQVSQLRDLNSRLFWYSDPHCISELRVWAQVSYSDFLVFGSLL